MLWIKEVEMVESVDDLKSSCSIRGIQMLNFEVLDARIASALNRIIHNTQFKRKVSLEEQKAQKEDRFLRGRQIAYLINDYLLFTGAHDAVLDNADSFTTTLGTSGSLEQTIPSRTTPTCSLLYADLFTISLRNDDIQEFDSKWDEILLTRTQIPSDDILEGLYKLRIRESDKLKTVLELYDLEIHQKKAGPDYHRLKTMVKRSIEQDLRNSNFAARNGNFERNAMIKNQGTKQRGQRILGDCWQWETNRQCSKGDNCSFRDDINKRAKMTQPNPSPSSFMQQNERKAARTRSPRGRSPSGRTSRRPCKDYLKGTCTNSFCEKWHPPECLFYKTENGCRCGEKCTYAHRQVDEQPSKRSKKNGDKSAVAMLKKHESYDRTERPVVDGSSNYTTIGLHIPGCGAAEVFIIDFTEELKHTEANPTCKIHESRWHVTHTFETKILRSDWFAQVDLISAAPTLQNLRIGLRKRQSGKSDGPAKQRVSWPKVFFFNKKNKGEKTKQHSSHLRKNRCLPASNLKPEEREFVVDSGASMHMISKKDLNSTEMETLTKSCSPTTVITAKGEGETHEVATVHVKELDIFLTMKVLENTPAVLSLGKLCDENGYSYEWINDEKPHLIKNGIRTQCNTENFVPIVVPGLSNEFFLQFSSFNLNDIFKTGEQSSYIFLKLVYFTNYNCIKRQWDSRKGDSYPVPVSSSNVEEMIERGDLLFAANPGIALPSQPKTKNQMKRKPR